jgi:DHA2 family methylenomycin A resistance protein-like MFS transporter
MVVLDTTIVNVALPTMGRSLGAGVRGLQWVVDAYTLAFGTLVLSAGHVSDRLGASAAFGRGLAAFTTASIVCGAAPSMAALVAARLCQGAAAALMVPSSLALVGQHYRDPHTRARAVSLWAAAGGAAVAAGPVIGGLLTDSLGWRTVFFVNVPIGILAWLTVARVCPSVARSGQLDCLGQLLVVLALGSLTAGVIEGGKIGFGKPLILLALVVCVLASAAFIAVERRADHPVVPLSLLRAPVAVGTVLSGLALYFSFYGVTFALSLFFQRVLHDTPTVSGLMFLPMTGLVTFATLTTPRLARRSGPWIPLAIGLAFMLAGLLALRELDGSSSTWAIALGTTPVGVGAGIAGPSVPSALLSAIPDDQAGVASGVANGLRQVAATLGVASFGAVFASGAFVSGMHTACLLSGATLVVALAVTMTCVRQSGAAVHSPISTKRS